jgi:hypothetical protein
MTQHSDLETQSASDALPMPNDTEIAQGELKHLTARSIKWNVIDKVSSQVLYAVTGIILARVLSHEDFGLVGAVLVFQAFASLFIDSGFSYALIQRKNPTRLDYSTVLWFNMAVAVAVYLILYAAAPDCVVLRWRSTIDSLESRNVLVVYPECIGHCANQSFDEAYGCENGCCVKHLGSDCGGCGGHLDGIWRVWSLGHCVANVST